MKLLITGATGFIGRNLILKLYKKHEITAIVRNNSDVSKIQDFCTLFYIKGNIRKLKLLINQERFDGVIHLATYYQSSHTDKDFLQMLYSNIIFGATLLEALSSNPPSFFINTTTFSQYANSNLYNPAGLYDATKQAFCDIMHFYALKIPTTFCNLLLYNTYGPNDDRPKIFNLWKKICQSREIMEMSNGEQKIDISHIDDVVYGFEILIKMCKNHQIPTLSTFTLENQRHTLKELAQIFEYATNTKLPIVWGAKPYRQNEVMEPISSKNSSISKLPHWEPKISLSKGIKLLYRQQAKPK